jgi:hypothetical protein
VRFLILIFALSTFTGWSQRNLKDSSVATVVFAPHYKFNLTGGDLNKLWGFNHQVGLDVGVKLKNNLYLGLDGGFIFGNQLKDSSMFNNVYTSNGTITGFAGNPAIVLFMMRGMSTHFDLGFVWNKFGTNPNSGLWLKFGGGYMMHKIRIESQLDDVPQLEGEYRKGYDRLTMGFSTKQFIGYLHQTDSRFLNFYAGLEFVQGFNKNVRTYNFDLGGPDDELKFDMLYSVKVGWLIPIYKRTTQEFYFD